MFAGRTTVRIARSTILFLALSTVSARLSRAAEVPAGRNISIGGVPSIFIKKEGAKGTLVLLTGGNGKLGVLPGAMITENETNVLIRNHSAFTAEGFNVLLLEGGTNLADAIGSVPRPVTVVATSAGTPRAAEGLLAGARPDKLVLLSGFLSKASGPSDSVAHILQRPELLPKTLVVHHRQDRCRFTRPEGVSPFMNWARGRAKVLWIDGGKEEGNPCRYASHHGFAGQDAAIVAAIASFAR